MIETEKSNVVTVIVDVIVIGAGAAGLMCAATAGQRGRDVLILDHANKVGKKILMSGGGRCNFTNLYTGPENYLSDNQHFCKSALSRYTQYDFLDLVNQHNLAYHEKTEGQLFCDNKAKDILNILLSECETANVTIKTDTKILSIHKKADNQHYVIETNSHTYVCESLVIATGGLSIPTMGATDFGFKVAKQFGLNIKHTEPALVPFKLTDTWLSIAQNLSGLSLDIAVTCHHQVFNEALLFTHRGLSGPAILQISNYWYASDAIHINFLPHHALSDLVNEWKQAGEKSTLKNLLARFLPKRFVTCWLATLAGGIGEQIGEKMAQQLNHKEINDLASAFNCWTIVPAGTEGYRTAEVTRGGVDTDGVSSKTFAAKNHQNLYFIGEVLDVTGWLGGFNFQWAWASGWCAGQYA